MKHIQPAVLVEVPDAIWASNGGRINFCSSGGSPLGLLPFELEGVRWCPRTFFLLITDQQLYVISYRTLINDTYYWEQQTYAVSSGSVERIRTEVLSNSTPLKFRLDNNQLAIIRDGRYQIEGKDIIFEPPIEIRDIARHRHQYFVLGFDGAVAVYSIEGDKSVLQYSFRSTSSNQLIAVIANTIILVTSDFNGSNDLQLYSLTGDFLGKVSGPKTIAPPERLRVSEDHLFFDVCSYSEICQLIWPL